MTVSEDRCCTNRRQMCSGNVHPVKESSNHGEFLLKIVSLLNRTSASVDLDRKHIGSQRVGSETSKRRQSGQDRKYGTEMRIKHYDCGRCPTNSSSRAPMRMSSTPRPLPPPSRHKKTLPGLHRSDPTPTSTRCAVVWWRPSPEAIRRKHRSWPVCCCSSARRPSASTPIS
jgi:hypothetical protein